MRYNGEATTNKPRRGGPKRMENNPLLSFSSDAYYITRSRILRNNSPCHRCRKGKIVTDDAKQKCDYCGRIFWESPHLVHFNTLQPGERFYCFYNPDDLLVKMYPNDRRNHHRDNYYVDGKPDAQGSCGSEVLCFREHEKPMRNSNFSRN